jgi:hypothetical protein
MPDDLMPFVPGDNEGIQIPAPRALTGGKANLKAIMEAILTNTNGRGIKESDLPRVKTSGGASPRFILTTPGGEETREHIDSAINYEQNTRVYHRTPYGQGTGNQADCTSDDGITGVGKPGGTCSLCPLDEWGSAAVGDGKACQERKKLFLTCDGLMLPAVFSLPPTSVRPAAQFFLGLAMQGIPYYEACSAGV